MIKEITDVSVITPLATLSPGRVIIDTDGTIGAVGQAGERDTLPQGALSLPGPPRSRR